MYCAVVTRSMMVARLADIATDQWGLITRRQAARAGIARATLDRLTHDDAILERVARGIYRFTVAPVPDNLDLRAAWLQLAPGVPAWERTPDQGVVSHRSAAALYGLGHLPADCQEFTVAARKQSRRPDVRLHHRGLVQDEWTTVQGLFVTRPARIASDLLIESEDPEAVANVITEAIQGGHDDPARFGEALAPLAGRFGLRRGDGLGLMHWLLDLVGDPLSERWMDEARSQLAKR